MNNKVKRIFTLLLAILTLSTTIIGVAYSLPEEESSDLVEIDTEGIVMPDLTPVSEPEFIPFDSDITFTSEYIKKDGLMPYGLFTPSSASDDAESAVIVWLSGAGERGIAPKTFMFATYFQKAIARWKSEGFNAYILCPQLTGKYNYSHWCFEKCETALRELLEDFVSTHNIDTDRIYLMGGSLGGQGAIYHAIKMDDVFNKVIIISGYPSNNINYNDLTIPALAFVGSKGEDSKSQRFMRKYIKPVVGEENFFEPPVGHCALPTAVLKMDEDSNGRSDVIEWLFKD